MKIEASDCTVEDLLKNFFFIPRFQRPYAWDKTEVDQFWEDTITGSEGDYFIGSLVLFREKKSYGVVDGQQRLTTIILMLCAIRDLFLEIDNEKKANGVQSIIERTNLDDEKTFALRTESSYPYLQDEILQSGPSQLEIVPGNEERLLAKMYNHIKSLAHEGAVATKRQKAHKNSALTKIRDKILGLRVIKIELGSEDDAYTIFETLNTRGKDLQTSHLVKNHIFRILRKKNKDLDPARLLWDEIMGFFEESQSEINPDAFLHHYWLSRESYTTEKKLFSAMKTTITKSNALSIVREMLDDARTYRSIVETDYSGWTKQQIALRRSVDALAVFKIKQPYPLILATLRAYKKKQVTLAQTKTILRAIECFHFTFTAIASKSSSGGISMMYASLAQRIYKANGDKTELQKIIKEIKEKLKNKRPSEEDFTAGFMELRFSNNLTKQKKLIRYILCEMESSANNTGSATDYHAMTIEHILPQNPESGNAIPGANLIGNLILCDETMQRKLGNKGFAAKRVVLKSSGLNGIESIVASSEWNEEKIKQRTRDMATHAFRKIWRQ